VTAIAAGAVAAVAAAGAIVGSAAAGIDVPDPRVI